MGIIENQAGLWFKSMTSMGDLLYSVSEDGKKYGFYENGEWFDDLDVMILDYMTIPLSIAEVERALTAEAIKRGFVSGCFIRKEKMLLVVTGEYYFNCGSFFTILTDNTIDISNQTSALIFKKGKWAEKANIFQELE